MPQLFGMLIMGHIGGLTSRSKINSLFVTLLIDVTNAENLIHAVKWVLSVNMCKMECLHTKLGLHH